MDALFTIIIKNKRIIEIELTNGKIGDAGSKALLSLVESLHQDVLLIFHGPKLEPATVNRKWFKSLSNNGCYLPLYDIETKALTPWLQRQARQLNVNLSNEVYPLLTTLFEGNLLALEQELQKLSILFGQQQITLQDAEPLVINQAKFNPFQLIDCLLLGQLERCNAILEQLHEEGTAVGQLIWFIHKEFKQLFAMLTQLQQGKSMNELFKSYRIWDKRKPLYQHALTHISLGNVKHAISRLADIDLLSKTSSEFNPFLLLSDICITLYHGDTMQHFTLNYELG